MSYNLFLDDIRNPSDCIHYMYTPIYTSVDWVIVRNYNEFVKTIEEKGLPEIVSFDHDLGLNVEVWKDVVGYEGIYQVSDLGRIIRIKKSKGTSGNYILKPDKNESGLYVTLYNKDKITKKAIHIIVCEAFYGIDLNKKYVNHKDGNRWDNNVYNLEWCTNSENVQHSYDELNRNYSAYGENHNNSKSVSQYDKNNNLIDVYGSINEASRQLKIQFTNIAKCARNERKSAGGFIWKYENKKPTKKSIIKHIKNKNHTENFFIPDFKEKTGLDCAKWLVNYCMDNSKDLPSTILVHSQNPVGKQNIELYFKSFIKSLNID